MPTSPVIQAAGLYTAPNALSARPAGALVQAQNVLIRHKGVIVPRPGQPAVGIFDDSAFTPPAVPPEPSSALSSLAPFGEYLIGHGAASNKLGYSNGASSFTLYSGTYALPTWTENGYSVGARLKYAKAQENFYFLTSTGVKALEAYNSTPRDSGIPRALDLDVRESTTSSGGSGTWFPDKTQVAYVCVWGRKDTHDTVRLGPPSGRTIFSNTSGAADGTQNILIPQPSWASSSYFYRIYRSETSPAAPSNTTLISPPEDVYLIYENSGRDAITGTATKAGSAVATFTSASHGYRTGMYVTFTVGGANFPAGTYEITVTGANTFTYNDGVSATGTSASMTGTPALLPALVSDNTLGTNEDIVPESLLGDPLYTNSDQEGALQANFPPPLCTDTTYWSERAWFSATTGKQRFNLRLLGVDEAGGVSTGLANDDTITIAGQTYTAKSSPSAAVVTQFLNSAAGTPALQVEATAKALVNAINLNTANTLVYAWYQSGENDAPGEIFIEARTSGAAAFTVYASNPYAWGPFLTTSSTGALSSSDDAAPHRLYYSKLQQGEAVPLLNYIEVGTKNSRIWRIVPLRDKLYVFKPEGTFTVAGQDPFRVDEFDKTAILRVIDSPAVVNNQLYCATSQGIVAMSDSGVQVVSGPVDNLLATIRRSPIASPDPGVYGGLGFGVGQETEGLYHFYAPGLPTDVTDGAGGLTADNTKSGLLYNVQNGTWVVWTGFRACAVVHELNDALYFGGFAGNRYYSASTYSADLNVLLKQADGTSYTDQFDASASVTISSWTAATSTLVLSSTVGIVAGDFITRGGVYGRVASVPSGTTLVMEDVSGTFTAGAGTWYQAINYVVEWAPFFGGAPGYMKQVREYNLHFSDNRFYNSNIATETDLSTTTTTSDLFFTDRSYVPGTAPRAGLVNKRVLVPQDKQRSAYVAATWSAFFPIAPWALNGISYEFDVTSERSNR